MSNYEHPVLEIAEGLPPQAVEDVLIMMRAAHGAGIIVRDGYDKLQVVEQKHFGDLVTEVDRQSEASIKDCLRAARPGYSILAEESSSEEDVSSGDAWVVDPVDATSAMIFRASPDMPAILIARLKDGVAQSSLVHFPMTDESFYAVRGYGAYKGKQRLHCSAGSLALSWVEMNQYGDSRNESPVFRGLRESLRRPGGAGMVSSSPPHSGVGVRIVEGNKRLAAVVHDNNSAQGRVKQAPWDVIPVMKIVEEAGGVVVNFQNQRYDPFKPEPFVMAASAPLAQEIIDLSRM